jgi:hypothetical protein
VFWSTKDRAEGESQLRRLAALDLRVACFGHGNAIIGDAVSHFRRRWPVGIAQVAEPGAAPDRGGWIERKQVPPVTERPSSN